LFFLQNHPLVPALERGNDMKDTRCDARDFAEACLLKAAYILSIESLVWNVATMLVEGVGRGCR
ncbi:MAG: hypothetical protein AB2818_16215, partial [Candidatus Thiodiazotropha sp.]